MGRGIDLALSHFLSHSLLARLVVVTRANVIPNLKFTLRLINVCLLIGGIPPPKGLWLFIWTPYGSWGLVLALPLSKSRGKVERSRLKVTSPCVNSEGGAGWQEQGLRTALEGGLQSLLSYRRAVISWRV